MAGRDDGGSRRVEVGAERLAGWLSRFADRHGRTRTEATDDEVVVTAADGAVARLSVPFPPLNRPATGDHRGDDGDRSSAAIEHTEPDAGLAAHVLRPRRVGVLLVRLGGHAVGVFDGDRLLASKVGSRQVHGRSAAGGWSQQRFARRREGQVRVAHAAAADVAVAVLLPHVSSLDAVVLGGDRRSVEAVLDDPRLAALKRLVVPPLLDVPDPKRAVLDSVPARTRSVRVLVVDPPPAAG